jgi:hypothetical protein
MPILLQYGHTVRKQGADHVCSLPQRNHKNCWQSGA